MPVQYWIVKQEPTDYGWPQFVRDGGTAWTGVRSFPARLHLRSMRRGDWTAFYHSGEVKELVGLARVTREAYPDPTADEGEWVCVDLEPVMPLKRAVSLSVIKADPALKNLTLVRQSRLSVLPVTTQEFDRLLQLADTPKPR